MTREYADAIRISPANYGEPTQILMVGNSLLLDGVDLNRLRELTVDSIRVHPVFLEGTTYYDWLYGLRRLFRRGARPQVVAVGIGAGSLMNNSVRTDYSPMLLFDTEDILSVASDLRLNHTATSNLALAHLSAFWNMRNVIRMHILARIIPNLDALAAVVRTNQAETSNPDFQTLAISRLRKLRELCESYGARLLIVAPPTPLAPQADRDILAAARMAGVEMLMPLDPIDLRTDLYRADTIHLNSEGAALFTAALAIELSENVAMR